MPTPLRILFVILILVILLIVTTSPKPESHEIEVTARIGITKSADLPLRFTLRNHPSVSR